MKIHTYGKMLNTPEARINYMTFKAESEEDRMELTRLYTAYIEGQFATPSQPLPITKRRVHREGSKSYTGEFSGPIEI